MSVLSSEENPNKPPIIPSSSPKANFSIRTIFSTQYSQRYTRPSLTEISSLHRKTHPHTQFPQLLHHSDYVPHLPMIPPHLIICPLQSTFPPKTLPLPPLLLIPLPYLPQIDIALYRRLIYLPSLFQSSQGDSCG